MQTDLAQMSKESVFNLAYDYECKGKELYENFGENDIFKGILEIRKKGITLLNDLATSKGYTLSGNDCDIIIPSDLQDKFIVALSYELELCTFYKNATQNADEDVQDLFFRLWATSNNEYIAALKANLNTNSQVNSSEFTQSSDVNSDTNSQMREFLDLAQKAANNTLDKDTINNLIKSPYFSFFTGIAAGGLLAMTAQEFLDSNSK